METFIDGLLKMNVEMYNEFIKVRIVNREIKHLNSTYCLDLLKH